MILTAGISKSATRRTRESSDRRERLMRTGDLTTTDIQITVSGSPTNLTVGDTFTSFCDPRAARTKSSGQPLPGCWKAASGRSSEPTKILPDQINLGRKAFERLSRSGQIGIFRGHFQLLRGFLSSTGLKCSNRALECVSRALDHHCVARIKTF